MNCHAYTTAAQQMADGTYISPDSLDELNVTCVPVFITVVVTGQVDVIARFCYWNHDIAAEQGTQSWGT
jgi:hypothetical protein